MSGPRKTYNDLTDEQLIELHLSYHAELRLNKDWFYKPRVSRGKNKVSVVSRYKKHFSSRAAFYSELHYDGLTKFWAINDEGDISHPFVDTWAFIITCQKFNISYTPSYREHLPDSTLRLSDDLTIQQSW